MDGDGVAAFDVGTDTGDEDVEGAGLTGTVDDVVERVGLEGGGEDNGLASAPQSLLI